MEEKMKTTARIIALLVVIVMLVNLAGCYGSFSLTRKLYTWNGSLGDKFVNTAVMWVLMILPIYEFTGFIDFVILNTVEFWTGSNPLAMQDGEQDIKYFTNEGKTYKIVITKNNVNILETVGPDSGKSINLSFTQETGNWSLSDDKHDTVIANLNADKLKLFYPNGEFRDIVLAK